MIVDCLLICAGKSSRMGSPKEKLLFLGKPFLINIIEKTLAVCSNLYLVVNQKNKEEIIVLLKEYLDNKKMNRLQITVNEEKDSPMLKSIQIGITATENQSNWLLLHQIDQPFLSNQFYEEFIEAVDDNYDWLQPVYKGKKGHPLVIGKRIFDDILLLNEDNTLKDISNNPNIKKKYLEFDYPEILRDIDTPQDYSAQLKIKESNND